MSRPSEYSATAGPVAAGVHEFSLENRHLPMLSVSLVYAALPKSRSVEIGK
jgi:hypothetical protein